MSSFDCRECYCALCSAPLRAELLKIKTGGTNEFMYNAELIDTSAVNWLDEFRCLGLNVSNHPERAFMSGRAVYVAAIELCVAVRGEDPNEPQGDNRNYESYLGYGAVFPIHDACYKIFVRNLASRTKDTVIRTQELYRAMEKLSDGYGSLKVDYGRLQGPNSFWDLHKGEEYATWNPSESSQVYAALKALLHSNAMLRHPSPPIVPQNHLHDPFAPLPYDILHTLTSYLSTPSALNLLRASPSIHASLRHDPTFWKRILRWDIFPWLWEAKPLFEHIDTLEMGQTFFEKFDFKKFYLWVGNLTGQMRDVEKVWMVVANRKRIWKACGEVGDAYLEELGENDGRIRGFDVYDLES